MNPPSLNSTTAKLLLGHVHRVGMSITSLESELQGTSALTVAMSNTLIELKLALRDAQQEIIDLRDGSDK